MLIKINTTFLPLAGLKKRTLIGATIGLTLMSLFLATADGADPSWHRFWFIKPLIITPIVAAMGGPFQFYIKCLFAANGWNKALAFVIGMLGFVVALWLGTILGLDGTYWD